AAEARAAAEQARAQEAQARIAAEKKQAEEAQARAEEATAKAKAERRARRLTLGLAAAALVLIGSGGIGAWVALSRMQEAGGRAGDRMEQVQRLLDEGWQKHDFDKLAEARAQADQAAEIAVGASDAVRAEVARLQEEVTARIAAAKKNEALLVAL